MAAGSFTAGGWLHTVNARPLARHPAAAGPFTGAFCRGLAGVAIPNQVFRLRPYFPLITASIGVGPDRRGTDGHLSIRLVKI